MPAGWLKDAMSAKYDNNDGRLRGRKLQARRLRIWKDNPHCAHCKRLVGYPYGFHLDMPVTSYLSGKPV